MFTRIAATTVATALAFAVITTANAQQQLTPEQQTILRTTMNAEGWLTDDPEPDVTVIREDENPDPRYADRFYLVAEVLSESDRGIIESKRDIYRAHASCTCILLIHQDRLEIIVERRTMEGWRSQVLHADDELTVPEFGPSCPVRDVYRDTSLG